MAVDPAIATGGIPLQRTWSAPRIAMQPGGAARGAVLENNGDVLTLALLIPVQKSADGTARLDGPADRIAWCAPLRFMANALNCYQDLDSDGKFETTRLGLLGTDEALALSRLQEPKPIEPLAYRAANDAELPRFQVGYRACGATVDRPHSFTMGELRFATVVRRAEGVQWPNAGRCDSIARLIETTPDGTKRFEMGRFKIDVREGTEQELATRLVEGIAPGTLLAHVRTSWPLTDATERPAEAEAVTGNSSFLVALGKPAIATRAKPGDEIFSVEVRHGLSGTLEVDSEPRLKRDKIRLPAGTPVYGIPMRSDLMLLQDAEVVWCTPFQLRDGKLRAHCFAPYLGGTSLVEAYSTPYAVRGVDPQGRGRNPPVVARGPAGRRRAAGALRQGQRGGSEIGAHRVVAGAPRSMAAVGMALPACPQPERPDADRRTAAEDRPGRRRPDFRSAARRRRGRRRAPRPRARRTTAASPGARALVRRSRSPRARARDC